MTVSSHNSKVEVSSLTAFRLLVEGSGISLPEGHSEKAFTRLDALRAVDLLRSANYPLLGGDVYIRRGDEIQLTHDNWYLEPTNWESRDTYVTRSLDLGERYMRTYSANGDDEALFVLVAGEPTATFTANITFDERGKN